MSKRNKLKFKKTFFNQTLILTISVLILGTVLALGIQIILADWQGPTEPPPGGRATTVFLDTSSNSQTKTGSLTIGGIINTGDLLVSGKTYGGYMGTNPMPAYFQDVWLDSPLSGGEGRWASTLDVSFNYHCQQISSGNCLDVTLGSDEQAGDEEKYVVTKIIGSTVTCCRPPKVPPPPPQAFPVTETIDMTVAARCVPGLTLYRGVALVKVVNANDGTAVSGATVYGNWSGATTKCENGVGSPCVSQQTDSNGQVFIKSFEVDGPTVYAVGYFRFTITKITHAIGLPPTDLPKFGSVSVSAPSQEPNTHIGSIEMTKTLVGNWEYQSTATVKVVNEAGIPIPGVPVKGTWSDSYVGVAPLQTTNEIGEVSWTTPSVWCWNVLPSPNPKFTFTVTGVYPEQVVCGIYNPAYNTPSCGCNSISVNLCNYPVAWGWGFSGNKKYAWGENIGWTNFQPTYGGVLVWDDCLEGYAWGENVGWINFGDGTPGGATDCASDVKYSNTSASDFGVNYNKITGNLSGYAWGENVGWISLRPPSGGGVYLEKVDEKTLKFHGYAWGENVGWINFDHTQTSYVPVVVQ